MNIEQPNTEQQFLPDLNRVRHLRQDTAIRLETIAQLLNQVETAGAKASGKLELTHNIATLQTTSAALRQGVFRLLVLGDMKRGKSTFLNALLGQNLLPSDVNPCTAVLTVLKYGSQERVTIHFKDGSTEAISFSQFKERYTIHPDEAKQLEQSDRLAFPNVSHAVVEHPLPLLGQGIELIDSPGLNDTEARNELSLSYLYNCHAVLFVLSASQPCTLDERRYLQNYLRDRGLSVFFLINGWDRVQSGLLDPEDPAALQEAETKVRQVFQSNLAAYCWEGERDLYDQRVFEISALAALRMRLKQPDAALDLSGFSKTGFPQFLTALNQFLGRDRAEAELKRATNLAQQAHCHLQQAMERRIPLLDSTVAELKQQIDSVESHFDQLAAIGQQFQQEISSLRDQQAQEIADSFKQYILGLESSFEKDFVTAQPNLDLLKFLDKNNRAVFYTTFKRAFERYMNDRLAAWEFIARQKIAAAFTQLSEKAAKHQIEYVQVLEAMNAKLLGDRFYAVGHGYKPDQASIWADTVLEMFSAIPDNLNGTISSFNKFWQGILFYVCASVALQIVAIVFTGFSLNVFAVILAGTGLFALQAESIRQQFLSTTKQEFAKHLPQIAEEQYRPIHSSVKKCFDAYAEEIKTRIDTDIQSRKAELDNLLAQKTTREIDRETEIQRLKQAEADITAQIAQIKSL
ncbi:MAG TPA: dynamin family protein [Coleofasciculaceae cyanobacterium]|jgi:GTPase SAR1 family protein